jgi:hypothetical protein
MQCITSAEKKHLDEQNEGADESNGRNDNSSVPEQTPAEERDAKAHVSLGA